ncbi:MAG: guanylate kinase [Alcaligenaceae bacterium]|nr:guanylate kinase [Alcaligenaceae bacterium]
MKVYPGNVFMVIAPSGAGKSTLVNALLVDDPSIRLSISCTTRAPRSNEVDGQNYHFISTEKFEQMIENDEFLEYAYVHGNYYGTPRADIEKIISKGGDVLLEIDVQGAEQIRQRFSQIYDIFILPPSLESLEDRLKKRGEDEPHIITKRLLAAGREISHASKCQYVIINDVFEDALSQMKQIVGTTRLRYVAQAKRHEALFDDYGLSFD